MDEQDEPHALDAPDRFAGRLGHGAVERGLSHAIVPFMEEKDHNCQLRQEKLRRGVKLEGGRKECAGRFEREDVSARGRRPTVDEPMFFQPFLLKGRTLQRVAEDPQ